MEFLLLVVALVSFGAAPYFISHDMPLGVIPSRAMLVLSLACLPGFFIVNPGEARALQLFGEYKGTRRRRW